MKKVLIASLLGGVFFIGNQVMAADVDEAAFTVGDISIQEVQPTPAEIYQDLMSASAQAPVKAKKNKKKGVTPFDAQVALAFDINDVITIGQKIYDIVKENQPVVTIKRSLVSVVPGGATDWTQLQGWQAPMTKVFEVSIKNLYNATTVYLRLKVTANYGGNAKGVGHYLANVNMVPTQVYAAWGYNVDVSVETATAVNAGSSADPIAGLGLDLRYHVHTLLSDVSGDQDYWLTGTGGLTALQ
jgi:hypothetical protein